MSNNNTDGTIRILQNHFDRIFLDQLFDESLLHNAIIRRNLITNHFPFIPEIEVEMQTKAELTAFTKFMKIILNVIKITIVEEEWDLASMGFKVFLGLCNNSSDKPYINKNITNMTNLAHLIFANQNADYNIIYDCGAFLIHLIEIKPKLFAKENLVISTLKLILLRISNEKTIIIGGLLELTGFGMPKLSTEDKLIADANSVYCTIIDKINEHIPGKYHKQFILQSIMDGLHSNQHDEIHLKQKKMSLIVAGLSCEGLKDLFSDELSILLPKIIDALINHPNLMIRECASYCLCQFSDYLDQSMDKYYQILIPAQLSVMNDSITLQFTTSHFFDNFLEIVNYQQIQEFVPSIYEHISHLLFSSNPNQNNNNNNNNNNTNNNNHNSNNQNNDNYSIFLQSRGLVMLSAFILCLEENIRIYQLSIISILKPLLINHQSEYFLLRGLALNTMGHLMKSLKCQGIDQEMVDIAIESAITNFELSKENDELMEDGFIFFLNIAAELKDQFSKYLIQIMPKVFEILKDPKCLDSEYHLLEYQQQFEQQQQQPQQDQQDQQDQEEGGNDDHHQQHQHQHQDHNHDDEEDEMEEIPFDFDLPAKKLKLFLNKITRILNFVAVVAFYTEKQFEPYFNEMIEIIFHYETIGLIHSSFEEIRAECMLLIHSLMVVHCSIHNIPQIKKITDPMNREEFELIVSFWDHCLDCLLLAIKEDESRKVVHNVFGTITRCCQNYGKSLLGYRIDEIFDGIIFYLNRLAPCQQSIEEDDQDDDDDDDDKDDDGKEKEEEEGNGGDHDDENDCLKDLINILDIFCKILLDDYLPYFENIQSLLLKFMKSNYSITQRSDALYCYSSIIDHLSPQITQKYIETILPILEQIFQSAESSPILRGNAVLVLSMIIDKYKNHDYFISHYSRFFHWLLMWLIQEDQDLEEGKAMEISDSMDNCIMALAQIILQFFARKKEKEITLLPLEKAFPMILKYLPLRDDEEPAYAEIVHEMLLNRLKEKDPRLINDEGLVKKLIDLFGETFRSESAVTNQSIEAMQFFERSYPSLLEKYLKRLTEKGENDQLVAIQKTIQLQSYQPAEQK